MDISDLQPIMTEVLREIVDLEDVIVTMGLGSSIPLPEPVVDIEVFCISVQSCLIRITMSLYGTSLWY